MDESVVMTAPFGRLGIDTRNDRVIEIRFLDESQALRAPRSGGVAAEAVRQIDAYFLDPAFRFTLPCLATGTPFQQSVWAQIARIPCGKTQTYRDIALTLHTAPRAVGGACGRNPLPLLVPCHRVVGCKGLGGFIQSTGRMTLSIKEWLLVHERTERRD